MLQVRRLSRAQSSYCPRSPSANSCAPRGAADRTRLPSFDAEPVRTVVQHCAFYKLPSACPLSPLCRHALDNVICKPLHSADSILLPQTTAMRLWRAAWRGRSASLRFQMACTSSSSSVAMRRCWRATRTPTWAPLTTKTATQVLNEACVASALISATSHRPGTAYGGNSDIMQNSG